MKKTALLIDGGWFCKGLGKILKLPNGWPNAAQVVKNAQAVLQADEELFRLFSWPLKHSLIEDGDGVRSLVPKP